MTTSEGFTAQENQEENLMPSNEGSNITISDGMEPIVVPERITKENFAAIFGGRLPEGISPEIFEEGGLELEQ
jgi:hypothetical protein